MHDHNETNEGRHSTEDEHREQELKDLSEGFRSSFGKGAEIPGDVASRLAEASDSEDEIIQDRLVFERASSRLPRMATAPITGVQSAPIQAAATGLTATITHGVNQEPKKTYWELANFSAALVGIGIGAINGLVGTAMLGVAIAAWKTSGDTTPPPVSGLSDQDQTVIKDQISKWQSFPDDKFWDAMATYVDAMEPSLLSQTFFMTFTQTLSAPATWGDQDADLIKTLTEKLFDAFTKGPTPAKTRTASMIYRLVSTFEIPDRTAPNASQRIPRCLAANLCALALTMITQNLHLQNATFSS